MKSKRQAGKKKKKEKRAPLPSSYLIATEGEKTEVLYFNGLKEEINKK
ncbi:RloB domain-containing protein [Carnobacterium iners]|nr:RloB domain-containing protein [Carnobacterium iners]